MRRIDEKRKAIAGGADYILPIGVLGLLGFLAYKFFGSGGPTGTGANNDQLAASNKAAVDQSLANQAAAGEKQTISDAAAQAAASEIWGYYSGGTSTADQVEQALMVPNNLTDLLLIEKYFGVKKMNTGGSMNLCALVDVDCGSVDLASYVKAVFNDAGHPEYLESVNSFYTMQGINYQF